MPQVSSASGVGCRPDWMGWQLVEVRLHGLWIGDVVSRNVVSGEIDDVEEPQESGVLAVIVVCMEMGFCGPWHVLWMTDDEEEENEVELHVGRIAMVMGTYRRSMGT